MMTRLAMDMDMADLCILKLLFPDFDDDLPLTAVSIISDKGVDLLLG